MNFFSFTPFFRVVLLILLCGRLSAQTGIITTFAGNGTTGYSGDGGSATLAQLNSPHGICIDPLGNLYIADQANYVVRKVSTSGIISTIAGTGIPGFSGDGGPATAAQLPNVFEVKWDTSGIYICTWDNRIRKIDHTGIITTVVGNGGSGFSGDGGPATDAQCNCYTLVFDAAHNMLIDDANNACIRKVDAVSGYISTVYGIPGYWKGWQYQGV